MSIGVCSFIERRGGKVWEERKGGRSDAEEKQEGKRRGVGADTTPKP